MLPLTSALPGGTPHVTGPVFAIETSCDETACAVVDAATRRVLAQQVYSQVAEHAPYGGVIPEIASRAHLERLPALAAQTLAHCGLGWDNISAIAATTGPGLTTALLIGSAFAKTLAVALGKPFLPTNHIEGHALSPLLADGADGAALAEAFLSRHESYVLLLVSGGHCQLVLAENGAPGSAHPGLRYTTLGATLDDAVGECFDKVGKLLDLPHPAGPAIEKLAAEWLHTTQQTNPGQPQAKVATLGLPLPKNDSTLDFSFAGLKTAVRELLQRQPDLLPGGQVAHEFQSICARILAKKAALALKHTGAKHLVAAGGVAANLTIRTALQQAATTHGASFTAPPLGLCTDNAAMIAFAAGLRHAMNGPVSATLSMQNLATPVRPRWPLHALSV